VFLARWKILHGPARLWNQRYLNSIMRAYIILHNMIIKDERDVTLPTIGTSEWPGLANPAISQHSSWIPTIISKTKKHVFN
jgi:hypothetical protein